ncbi:MAG: aspartate carbamoyltransferase [Gammaproteobacteria bacterium]|nr:aspartate carbamoyltransferase [Gammaproteobacteria bacterium]MYC26099.1 aspartate carbamoyltransferase [Gammaproteobacteria bacterium]
MNFVGEHILSVAQLNRADVEEIFAVADKMTPFAHRERVTRVLDGAVLCNLFFEASTRTRLSFGAAFNLLGGSVRETTDMESTSLVKGESLKDFARVVSAYSDVIVMRHPIDGAVAEFAESSRSPVLNGGDGSNEHPTQALLDVYTIKKELRTRKKGLDDLRIAVIGDLKYGRAVHSLIKLLKLFRNITVHLIAPPVLSAPESVITELQKAGHEVRHFEQLEHGIQGVDVLYMTRTQEERFSSSAEAREYQGLFRINQAVYSQHCEPDTVIMHPLPRDSREAAQEVNVDLDSNPNLAVFRQSDNGLIVRMALFALILDVVNKVEDYSTQVGWFTDARKWD